MKDRQSCCVKEEKLQGGGREDCSGRLSKAICERAASCEV